MAIYHLSVKAITRSAGRSATAAAAYRAGCEIADERTGAIHDYTRKGGVASADIVLPDGAPEWATDRAKLWNAAELAEKRKDACVAREFEVALPSELSSPERRRLALDFARDMANREGCAVDVAIHAPGRGGDNRNHHAHILRTTRKVETDGLGAKLDTEKAGRKRSDDLEAVRAKWAELVNARLRENGIAARVDHRSLEAQGIDREPTQHLGPAASGFERRTGQPSDKRIQQEQEAAERLARAQALGELERQAREIDRSILDLSGDLEAALAERDRLQAEQAAEQARSADPAAALAEWLSAPPIPLRGSMEGLSRRHILDTLCACQADNLPAAALLGEAEQSALRQAHWMDSAGNLTPKGLGAVQRHQAQQAVRDKAARASAEQERAQAAERLERQRRQAEEQERLDAQTAAGAFDGLRAPRRSAQEWQQWRAQVLIQAYGDQIEASELARHWRVQRPRDGQPLTLYDAHGHGQSIADYGDRIVPSGDERYGIPLKDDTLRTALQLAQRKGWDHPGLDITGSSAFRERAARMATRMGLTVANADLQHIVMDEQAEAGKQQARKTFAQFKAEQTARQRSFSTKPVDIKSPHAAPQPAPQQTPVKVPEKQATPPDPARAEALAWLGENPTERRTRWDALVQRVATPPQPTQDLQDPQAALAAWQASRTQRGLSTQDTAHVFDRCTRYGWTAAGLRTDWQRQVDALREEITDLERSGKRWIGGNRNAQQIAQLTQQRERTAQRGNAELDLARDWEAFKPQVLAQEYTQRLSTWQQDAERKQRLAPHVLPILEQDRQAAEQAKAEKEAREAREAREAQQAKQAERETPQRRPTTPRRSKTPDQGMGMG